MKCNSLAIKAQLQTNKSTDGKLYFLLFQRLLELRTNSNSELIKFPEVFIKLCKGFSAPKPFIWELLFFLRDVGIIKEIKCGHGIILNKEFILKILGEEKLI